MICPTTSSPVRVGFMLHAMQVAGAEMLVAETIRRLGARIEPTVICLDHIGQLGAGLQQEGVPVLSLNRRPGRDWRLIGRLLPIWRERHIEVVHAHQYSPFFYAALAKAVARRAPRLILTEHGRFYPDLVSWKRRLTNRLVLSHLADAINACCQFSARALSENDGFPARRIEVLANGIDFSRYDSPVDRTALRQRLGLDADRRYVICVARLHPVKDHATLLKAFAEAALTRPDMDLLLAGDGPLRDDLLYQAESLKVGTRVRFLGVRSDVPDLLRAVDVFAMTSVSEAASLTLMEALAAGLPVVVTNVGGNPEIVRDQREGLLVPRGDWQAGAGALGRLLDDPGLARRLGQAGRVRVQEHFPLERTVQGYWNLYQSLRR